MLVIVLLIETLFLRTPIFMPHVIRHESLSIFLVAYLFHPVDNLAVERFLNGDV